MFLNKFWGAKGPGPLGPPGSANGHTGRMILNAVPTFCDFWSDVTAIPVGKVSRLKTAGPVSKFSANPAFCYTAKQGYNVWNTFKPGNEPEPLFWAMTQFFKPER